MYVPLAGYRATGKASKRTNFLHLTALCLLITSSAFAQSDRGTITGSVADPSTAAVVGAKVDVRNVDNGSTFTTTTTSTGAFTVTSVPSGKYNLSVTSP